MSWLSLNPVIENLERHDHTHLTYDPSREQVLVVDPTQGLVIYTITGKPAPHERILSTPTTKGNVRHVKLSPNDTYLGLVYSAKTIDMYKVVDGTLNLVNSIHKDAKSSDVILGFEWTFENEFIIVTRNAVEFYSMSKSRKIFVYRKSILLSANWYFYSHEHKFLLLSGGTGPLYLFNIKKDYKVSQLPSLDILSKTNTQKQGGTLLRKNIFLLTLYERIYCAFVDVSDKESTLLLHRISFKLSHVLEYTFNLEHPGPFLISELDNLVIAHSLHAKVSAVYDIKSASGPTTSRLLPYRELDVLGIHDSDFYLESWQPFSPDFILSPSSGTFYEISLNLNDVILELKRQVGWTDLKILEFLFRRSDEVAGRLALRVIRGMILAGMNLATLRLAFNLVNDVAVGFVERRGSLKLSRSNSTSSVSSLAPSSRPSRASSPARLRSTSTKRLVSLGGATSSLNNVAAAESVSPFVEDTRTTIGSEDMHTYVFKPISEDKDVPPRYLQTVLLEYISSTSSRSLPTLSVHAELLVTLLLRMQRVAELQQMIATGVVPPCASVALLLVKADVKGERMDAIEMGIAMLGRLGMHEEVVEVLVRNGKTVDALRHAIQTNTLQRICPTQFLESSYTSNDLTQFLNVFRELEERGIVPSVTDMVDVFEGDVGESIVRFVSVFREIWGEVVEMEGI